MAPKGKKAAGAGKRAGGVYKDDRVPDPAIATEGYAAVSLYRCSTVEAILVHPRFPVPQTLHAIPHPPYALPLLARLLLAKVLFAFNVQLIRRMLHLAHSSSRGPFAPPLSD